MATINDYIKKAQKVDFCVTKFLDTTESSVLRKIKDPNLLFYFEGGYSEAERVKAIIITKGQIPPEKHEFEISALKLTSSESFININHRHVLGTLMSLGIKRDVIGDILVSENEIIVFASTEMNNFLQQNLTHINHLPIDITIEDITKIEIQKNEVEQMINVASLRLDAVIAKVLNISRNKSEEMIEKGLVQINHIECLNTSYFLKENDLISVRHFGRIRFVETTNKTKKDRLVIKIVVNH